jgi:hypothetical protein
MQGAKPLDGAIEGPLHLRREETGRQLTGPAVIGDALATESFFVARLIGAITDF